MVAEKYAVLLSAEDRAQLERLIRSGQCSARVINRARILLKTDEAVARCSRAGHRLLLLTTVRSREGTGRGVPVTAAGPELVVTKIGTTRLW